MASRTLSILVQAIGAAKAAKDLKGVDKTVSSIGGKAGQGIRTAATNLVKLGTVAAGAAAAGLVTAVKAAGDFEAQLNTINTVASLSQTQLDAVGSDIRKLARDTGGSLDDLTGAYYDLVSAGIKPGADALNVLTLANTLAIGGLATTGETVDLLTTAINTYGLNAQQAAVATDQFAEAIALGKVTASEIAQSFATVGPLAQSAGIGIDEIAASYATLTAKGIPAAEAATNMRSAITSILAPTAELSKASKKLGVDFAKVARNKGLPAALAIVRKYSEQTGIPLKKLLGRIEAVQYTLTTTGENADDYASALKQVQDASGTAAEQMGERQRGLNYELGRLKALAKDAAITIGSKLIPKLVPLADKAVKFLETHQPDIDKFGDQIAGAFEKAAEFATKIPWGAIGSGLQTAATWAGTLMDAFMALPSDVKSTIIALAGLNKLTGGAVGGIVSELGKGLVKGVLGINAGVVNVRGAVVNGGGVGGAGGAAAVGAKGGIGTLGKMFLVGEAIGLIAAVNEVRNSISAGLVTQATDIDTSVQNQINSDKTNYASLKQSLDAVNSGINDISSNPLNVLVGGEALDQLKNTRTDLAAKIKSQEQTFLSSFHASERQEAITAAATKSGDASIVSAIHGIKMNVTVPVSLYVSGDTRRVTKNYQSSSNIGKPGGPKSGGPQEFD